MSLNQKYTWNDFLKENPELKTKGVKRTSSEGKKAFEAAFKAKAKDVLKNRLTKIEKETTRTTTKRDNLITEMKATKKVANKRKIQKKVGKSDKYLSNLTKMTKKTKEVQKSI